MDIMLPHLLTPSEAADRLAMTTRTLERLARRGEVPCVVMPGGALAFDPADLAGWVARRKAGSVDKGE